MANTIKIKRSAVQGKVPVVGDLSLGELALNTYDGKLYTLKNDGTSSVIEIGANAGGNFSADISLQNQSSTRYYESSANGNNYIAVRAPSTLSTDVTLTLPANDGDPDQVLGTDGNGNLSWVSRVSGTGTTGDFLVSSTSSEQSGYFGNILLKDDSNTSHYLEITNSADLTALRTLSINVNDANRTISLSGNLTISSAATISGTNTGDQTITLTGDVTGSGTGSFAATIASDAVTFAKIQNSAAAGLSVIGRSTNSAGDFAEINAGTDGHVLRRSGTTVGFGTIATGGITDNAVTYAKIQDVSATDRLLGRSSAGAGDIQEITCTAAGRALLDDADAAAQRTTLGLGTIATQASDNVSITGGSISSLSSLSTSGDITVGGNLIINGTTTTVNSTITTLDDPIITLGGDTSTAEITKDRGVEFKYAGATVTITNFIGAGSTTVTGTVASTAGYVAGDIITISGATGTEQAKLNGTWTIASVPNGTTFTFIVSSSVAAGTLTTNLGTTVRSKNGFFGLDQSTGRFTFIPQANNASEVFSGTLGDIQVNDGYFSNIHLYDDSTPSHYLGITNSANLTAARTLAINVNDADRTISLSGDLTVSNTATVSGTNTGDQTITLTGDVTGSGTGSFATTLANSGVTAGTYKSVTVDVKGRVTAGTNPTTLDGYGITDALSNSTTSTQTGYFGNIALYDDSTPSHYLTITNSANLTAARTLSVNVNDVDRTISLFGNLTLANNFTTSGAFALTLTTTAATNVTLPTSGTLATTGNLSQFASTTSAQLAGVISDETGSGALVFATSPTLVTPTLGNAASTTLTVGNRVLTSSYNCWSETGSGAMGILGHNARSGAANNTVVANVSSWHGHFIRMYYSDGIAIHTTTGTVTAGDVLYDQSTPANQVASSGERVRVRPDGNVGIGVTSPSFKADIAGDVRVTSTNKMRFGGTAGTTNFYIQYNSTSNSLDFVAG